VNTFCLSCSPTAFYTREGIIRAPDKRISQGRPPTIWFHDSFLSLCSIQFIVLIRLLLSHQIIPLV